VTFFFQKEGVTLPKKEKKPDISGEEYQIIHETAATYVDKIYLTSTASGAKITFAENGRNISATPAPRVSIFIPLPTLVSFRDLLVRTCENMSIEVVETDIEE
jgi:sulfur relay (sulfurtransferase) complex TusBCD TusD component (DsrE family)